MLKWQNESSRDIHAFVGAAALVCALIFQVSPANSEDRAQQETTTTTVAATETKTQQKSTSSGERVKKETSEAMDATGEYAKESKDEFVRSMESNLKSLSSQIESLEKQASQASSGAAEKIRKQIAELKTRQDDLENDLQKIKASSNKAYGEMRKGFVRAWTELKTAYKSASGELSSKNENSNTESKKE